MVAAIISGSGSSASATACSATADNTAVQLAVVQQQGSGPGPGGISSGDWAKVQTYAGVKQIDPLVLVAIGKHETNWGQAGDGRLGNVLGVGSYDSGSTYKFAGIDGQLAEGTRLLASWGVHTIGDITAGKAADWATDPGWESAVAKWYSQLGGTGQIAPTVPVPVACTPAENAVSTTGGGPILDLARTFIGTPYLYGGEAPGGFDCSGLTSYVYLHAAGKTLPRTAAAQQAAAHEVTDPQPGDLVFFGSPATHVGLVIDGAAGMMLDAPNTGSLVRIESYRGWHDLAGFGRF